MIARGIIVAALWVSLGLATADGADVPSSVERPTALAGSGYTVLGRTFLGESGNISYLRLMNLSGADATVNATLVGSPSGRNYGTTQISIPNNASRQIRITLLMSDVGIGELTSPDTRLAVYLQTGADPVAVQHVLFSGESGFFENLSSCQNSSFSDGNSALINVHTSLLPAYVSTINIHNFGDTEATYDIDIYNAETGAHFGRVPVTIQANTTFEQPFVYFENQINIPSNPPVLFVNMVAFPRSGVRTALMTHTVLNSTFAAYLNLTNFCTIAPTLSGRPVANDDNIPVPSGAQNFAISFSLLTANDSNATNATLIGVTQPRANGIANGALTQTGNNLTFTPTANGLATFEYRLRNSVGDSHVATVTLNIGGDLNLAGQNSTTSTLAVSKSGTGSGTISSSQQPGISCGGACTYQFDSDRTVTLTAMAASGAAFLGWGGACSGTSMTCDVAMSSNKSVTATFGSNILTVSKIGVGSGTVTSGPAGINCGATCSSGFVPGTTTSLTALPATGSTFLGWSGCTGTTGTNGNICNVDMNGDKTITATFGTNVLTVSKIGSGLVTSSSGSINCGSTCSAGFGDGTIVSLTATPASGLNVDFLGWSGCTSTAGSNGTICSVTMTSGRSVTATFR